MPKSEREEMLSALTSRIFSTMLDDMVMDAALQSHHEIARSRAVCRVCNTRHGRSCGSVHTPGPLSVVSQAVAPPSRPATPSSAEVKTTNGSLGTGASTPTSVKADGNIYFECLNCNRQVASNRYAPHLSSCIGLGTGTRRGAARGNVKSKHSSEAGRSASPPSETGNISEDSRNIKGKGKSKSKRADEAEFNLKRKRPVSPQITPNKKQKKQKSSGSPVSRVKADPDVSGMLSNTYHLPSTSSQSKVPSKLRDSSTAPFLERSSTPGSSRSSSPGAVSVATPSSTFSVQSLGFAGKGSDSSKKAKGKVANAGPPKRLSPPRPPPPPIQDYNIDVEGEETGSSTDTDSS